MQITGMERQIAGIQIRQISSVKMKSIKQIQGGFRSDANLDRRFFLDQFFWKNYPGLRTMLQV